MNDELDVLAKVVAYHDHIAVPVAPVDDDVRRGRRRVRRTRGLVAGGTALGVAAIVTTAALVVTEGDRDSAPPPIAPTPSETATDPVRGDGPRNGPIVRAEKRYPPGRPACAGCSDVGFLKAFDPVLDRALWSFYDLADLADGATQLGALSVVASDGEVAALGCPDDFACRPLDDLWTTGVTLGPGSEQLTIESADQELQVIRFDGSIQRTLDLSTGLDPAERVDALAWSPDRSRIAVQTSTVAPGTSRIWLFDRGGDEAVLVHTPRYPVDLLPKRGEFGQLTFLSGLSWSPDGTRLGFVEEFTHVPVAGGPETEISSEAVAVEVQDLGQDGPGTATALYRFPTRPNQSSDGQLVWSPDGTRVAVVARGGILELSLADGSVLARHPRSLADPDSDLDRLVWPARQRWER